MNRELEPGMRVRLHNPERGYWYAELVKECWLRLLRLSSGYAFTLYADQFPWNTEHHAPSQIPAGQLLSAERQELPTKAEKS
jgi:hypothetical protein